MTRSATQPNPAKPNLGMNLIGLLLAAGTLFLLLPLLPFLAAFWVVDKLRGDE
ncbi:MAG TPA: hypothetical protein VKM69_11510 [Natronoarchaeum rubrum]|nr:hypothetical protein [Natronoarchaeum rubrum]